MACERLSQYLLASKFILETDHKPLIPLLLMKNLDLPFRVQRFRLRMMRYQYEIIHVPGKELNTSLVRHCRRQDLLMSYKKRFKRMLITLLNTYRPLISVSL